MTRPYLLLGLLAALCHQVCGVAFNDRIKQDVGGVSLALLHDVGDPTSVKFGVPPDFDSQAWQFNTEGFNDDEAVITPLNSSKTLVCEMDSKCRLDLGESKQAYRVTRANGKGALFTFQDLSTSLYVSRTSGQSLELTDVNSDSIYFQLEAIRGNEG
ncbi:uncharacterized protein N7503_002968 [Penicillium pulvis]|uniref:uncharacterized protein n=1 Tax=Penicillium pulvis TaxID=1562058 RepID=UPI002549B413|nr:uncharacterized protein N7503_002968 [Penicillium pulvis]KAJ5810750.1 hypothetical protein N7503_002968 [Penicillium pulvis]